MYLRLSEGIYFGSRKMTRDDYLMASHEMHPIPVGLSIFVSCVSALSIVSLPGEIYMYGNAYLWNIPAIPIVISISCYTILPVFYRTKSESVYTYLEMRFGTQVSYVCLIFAQLSWMAYIAICIFSPALAIKTLLGMEKNDVYLNMGVLCIICITYTLLGGMKAVIWTDVFQGCIMVLTILFIFCKMINDLGFGYIVEKCFASKCNTVMPMWLNVSNHFDITYRTPPATFIIRQFLDQVMMISLQQSMVQRFQMCGSMTKGRQAFAVGTFFIVLTESTTIFIGMAALAFYYGLDPLQLGRINRSDEITPLLIYDNFSAISGFTGIFLVATCSATLSSFSTFLSSSATVILPLAKKAYAVQDDVRFSKILILIVGIATYLLAVLMCNMNDTLMGILSALTANIGAPFFGCCLGGMLIPSMNRKGAMAGLLSPLIPISIQIAGNFLNVVPTPASRMKTDLFVDAALLKNTSWTAEIQPLDVSVSPKWMQLIFCQSPFVFGLMGLFMFFVIAVPVSWLTHNDEDKVSSKLLIYYKDEELIHESEVCPMT